MPKIVTYVVHIEPASEGGFIAHFPAVRGCFAQGETLDEVITMAQDALTGFLELLRVQGQPIPEEFAGHKFFSLDLPLSVKCLR